MRIFNEDKIKSSKNHGQNQKKNKTHHIFQFTIQRHRSLFFSLLKLISRDFFFFSCLFDFTPFVNGTLKRSDNLISCQNMAIAIALTAWSWNNEFETFFNEKITQSKRMKGEKKNSWNTRERDEILYFRNIWWWHQWTYTFIFFKYKDIQFLKRTKSISYTAQYEITFDSPFLKTDYQTCLVRCSMFGGEEWKMKNKNTTRKCKRVSNRIQCMINIFLIRWFHFPWKLRWNRKEKKSKPKKSTPRRKHIQ